MTQRTTMRDLLPILQRMETKMDRLLKHEKAQDKLTMATLDELTQAGHRYQTATQAVIDAQAAKIGTDESALTADQATIASDDAQIAALQTQQVPDTLVQQINEAAAAQEAKLAQLTGTDPAAASAG